MTASLEPGRAAAHPGRRPLPREGAAGPSPPEGAAGPYPREGAAGPSPPEGAAGPYPREGAAGPSPPEGAAGPFPRAGAALRRDRPRRAPGRPGLRLAVAWPIRGTPVREGVTPAWTAGAPAGAARAGLADGAAASAAWVTGLPPGGCPPSPGRLSRPGRGRLRARATWRGRDGRVRAGTRAGRARAGGGGTPGGRQPQAGGVRCRAASGSASSSPARPSAPSPPWSPRARPVSCSGSSWRPGR